MVSISKEAFTWGRSLNVGIEHSRGEFVIILSADAFPADHHWVREMLRPFSDPLVAAVYGRQVPRPDAPVDEVVRLAEYFGPVSQKYVGTSLDTSPTGHGLVVSNACAAVRRSVWEDLHYDESIRGGEEGVWTHEVLRRGYSCEYTPAATVFHSHRDTPLRWAMRAWELSEKNRILKGRRSSPADMLRDVGAICKRRLMNCRSTLPPLRARIDGLARLPWEIAAFLAIAACDRLVSNRQRLRDLVWG